MIGRKLANKVIKNYLAKELYDLSWEVERKHNSYSFPIISCKSIQTEKISRTISTSCETTEAYLPSTKVTSSSSSAKTKEKGSEKLEQEIQDLQFKLNLSKQALKDAKKDLKIAQKKAQLEMDKNGKIRENSKKELGDLGRAKKLLKTEIKHLKEDLKVNENRTEFLEKSLANQSVLHGSILSDIFKSRIRNCMRIIPILYQSSPNLASQIIVVSLWRSQVSKLLFLFAKWTGFCNACKDYIHHHRRY